MDFIFHSRAITELSAVLYIIPGIWNSALNKTDWILCFLEDFILVGVR